MRFRPPTIPQTTERTYLDNEHAKLATTLGAVVDQAKFNNTDLISDTAQTTKTIHSGADAGDTTTINFKAITEQLLGVDSTIINLAGTTETKEVTTIASITVSDAAAVYTLTVDGVVYTSASTDANMNTLNTALMAATADDGTVLGDLFTATNTGDHGRLWQPFAHPKGERRPATADFTLAVASGDTTSFAAGVRCHHYRWGFPGDRCDNGYRHCPRDNCFRARNAGCYAGSARVSGTQFSKCG